MKRLLLTCLIVLAAATSAWSLDLRQGFGKYRYGETCQKLFAAPSFAVERARPIWNAQLQMFGLAYDPDVVAKSPFVLRYDKDEKPNFDGVPLNRVYYGCDKNTDRFSLVVLVHDLLAVKQLVEKTTAALGPPTNTTMIQTIWALPDLYVQIDQVYMIIYDRRAGKI
ncbi:MAG: hypothetical protein ACP59X_22130 [Solidesulfovibrio sp. DCME]|uniref:hypothetical protein n=1 Tax=Solidesulfovibrio sp. DCME TaxID=3447380 RepID=UPI003D134D2A